jgi:hypothetical protein
VVTLDAGRWRTHYARTKMVVAQLQVTLLSYMVYIMFRLDLEIVNETESVLGIKVGPYKL